MKKWFEPSQSGPIWLHKPIANLTIAIWKITGYCYRSVNVIKYGLIQNDDIKRRLLYTIYIRFHKVPFDEHYSDFYKL